MENHVRINKKCWNKISSNYKHTGTAVPVEFLIIIDFRLWQIDVEKV